MVPTTRAQRRTLQSLYRKVRPYDPRHPRLREDKLTAEYRLTCFLTYREWRAGVRATDIVPGGVFLWWAGQWVTITVGGQPIYHGCVNAQAQLA